MHILDSFRLDGRRAVITGGSRGLGLAMARALGQAGAELVLVGREQGHLDEAKAELSGEGLRVSTVVGDLGQVDEAERVCDLLLKEFDPIDILINNVGGRRINIPTEELALADWQKIIDLNLTQAFLCTKKLGGAMLKRGKGRVINVSSISGQWAGKAMRGRAYETSKAALSMFTKAVAADWAPHGVTVNAIAPGPFLTDANRRWVNERPEFKAEVEQIIPMGRWGEPHEIGGLALLLASDASSFITGSVVVIDGGKLLW